MFDLSSITDTIGEIGGLVEGLADPIVSGVRAVTAVKTAIGGGAAPTPTIPVTAFPAAAPVAHAAAGGYVSPSGEVSPVATPLPVTRAAYTGGQPLPVQQALGMPFVDILPGGAEDIYNTLTSAFRPTYAGHRAQLHVLPNPTTGQPTYFRPCGRPILFSGDLGTVKRVRRIARHARRRVGG